MPNRIDVPINTKRINFLADTVFYSMIAAGAFLVIRYALPLLMPFLIAFAVAALLQKPTRILSGRIKAVPKKIWFIVLTILFYVIIATVLALTSAWLVSQIVSFIKNLPEIASEAAKDLARWSETLPPEIGDPIRNWIEEVSQDVIGSLNKYAGQFSGPLLDAANGMWNGVWGFAASVPAIFLNILFVIIGTFFLGMDYDGTKKGMLGLFPKGIRPTALRAKQFAADTLLKLIRAYAFLMFLTFAELSVGFAIINLYAKIDYVVPLALIIALVDILPVVGAGTVILPWAIIDLINRSWTQGISLIILYLVIIFVRNFLEPKLVGQRFGLHPAATLVALFVGGKLFGVLGVFLLPLSVIVIKRMLDAGIFGGKKE